jgi:flagellar biosynthetic protein FliP
MPKGSRTNRPVKRTIAPVRQVFRRRAAEVSALIVVTWLVFSSSTFAQNPDRIQPRGTVVRANSAVSSQTKMAEPAMGFEQFIDEQQVGSSLKFMIGVTILSIAPSILIMTTCFVRFVIVLGLLKQALGTNNLPPNQVIVSLCLFLTLLVMSPVWKQAYHDGIEPYTEQPGSLTATEAFQRASAPLRKFMSDQIENVGNSDVVWMLLDYQQNTDRVVSATDSRSPVQTYNDVPISVLLPAYMLSEIKTAFVIGFQIYLPFLIIDMVVSSVLVSMGMVMLPPVMVSLPFKLLLFVLIDGWFLTVGMLLESVTPFG